MNRTDRLYAIVEELRARAPRPVRAGDLARTFEVSVRTIERDLQALLQAGVPIWSQPGPGGGYALDPRRTLPPVNFTASEATAIAAALASAGRGPFAATGRSALRKIVAAMSQTDAQAANMLSKRIWAGAAPSRSVLPRVVRAVEQAVAEGLVIDMSYADAAGRKTRRKVEAHGLMTGPGGWHLVGWCRMRDDARVFRLSRIRSASVTREPVPRRDLAGLVRGFGRAERPVADMIADDEEAWVTRTELLERLRAEWATWTQAVQDVPAGRTDEPGVAGDWSAHDVVNHVNAYDRFYLYQAKTAFTGMPLEDRDLFGERTYPEGERDESVDQRNESIRRAGRALTWQHLLEEGEYLHAERERWIASLPEESLEEALGWAPYWDPSFEREQEGSRLVFRVSEVAGLVQPMPLWQWAIHGDHMGEHADQIRAWLTAPART